MPVWVKSIYALRHTIITTTTTGSREDRLCIDGIMLHMYSIKVIDFIDCSKINFLFDH